MECETSIQIPRLRRDLHDPWTWQIFCWLWHGGCRLHNPTRHVSIDFHCVLLSGFQLWLAHYVTVKKTSQSSPKSSRLIGSFGYFFLNVSNTWQFLALTKRNELGCCWVLHRHLSWTKQGSSCVGINLCLWWFSISKSSVSYNMLPGIWKHKRMICVQNKPFWTIWVINQTKSHLSSQIMKKNEHDHLKTWAFLQFFTRCLGHTHLHVSCISTSIPERKNVPGDRELRITSANQKRSMRVGKNPWKVLWFMGWHFTDEIAV